MKTKAVALPKARTCDEAIVGTLELDFEADITSDICPDQPFCNFNVQDCQLAPDGSLWIVRDHAIEDSDARSAWLAHCTAEGEFMRLTDGASTSPLMEGGTAMHEIALVVDKRSHALGAVYEVDGGPNADSGLEERTWVQEFAPSGRPAGPPALVSHRFTTFGAESEWGGDRGQCRQQR